MNRQDFMLRYLIALYKVHRRERSSTASVNSLKGYFDLPEDDYLEQEVPEMLAARGWAMVPTSTGDPRDTFFQITAGGKEAAEKQIEQGVRVDPREAAAASEFEEAIPDPDSTVSLSPSTIAAAEVPLNELIAAVEETNGDPEEPSFRQRILGQIRAGRELIRSGEYKLFLLQATLIAALNELIARYKDGVIAGLAANLLQQLPINGIGG